MNISELLLPEFDNEMTVTRRILERVPDDGDKGSWKPHEKSFPLAHLAQLVARLPSWVPMVLDKTEFDIAPPDGSAYPGYSIEKTATLLGVFDKGVADGRAAIARTTDDQFQVPWHFKRGGVVQFTQPVSNAARHGAESHRASSRSARHVPPVTRREGAVDVRADSRRQTVAPGTDRAPFGLVRRRSIQRFARGYSMKTLTNTDDS